MVWPPTTQAGCIAATSFHSHQSRRVARPGGFVLASRSRALGANWDILRRMHPWLNESWCNWRRRPCFSWFVACTLHNQSNPTRQSALSPGNPTWVGPASVAAGEHLVARGPSTRTVVLGHLQLQATDEEALARRQWHPARGSPPPRENTLDLLQRFAQLVDFFEGIVEVEAGPGGGAQAEVFVQRHGAMMAGADGHSVAIQ